MEMILNYYFENWIALTFLDHDESDIQTVCDWLLKQYRCIVIAGT